MDEWAPDIPLAVRSELPPFGIKPHWVTFGFTSPANRLYDLYNAHVDRKRGDLTVWPTLDDLAKMMGLSRGDKVTPYMRELETGGAIAVQAVTKTGGKGRRYVVTLRVHPPAGFDGPMQSSDWHHAHRPNKSGNSVIADYARGVHPEDPAGSEVHPAEGVYPPPADGGDVHPAEGAVTKNHLNQNQNNQEQTSVADAVGQGAGGLARAGACEAAGEESGEDVGGCAAPATDIPPQRTTSPRPRTVKTRPRSEAPGFDTVRAALPASVAAPGTRLYTGLHRALNDLLTGNEGARIPRRTPDQVIARINRCWFGQKAEERSAPGYEGADRIRNRSSWLAAAILAQDCPDPACESGRILGSDQPCPVCRERAQERRAARSAVQDAADRMEADTEALRGARAVAEQWETDRAAEEYHVRTGLAQEGMYGEKLHYNVAKHMANWRERHPKPGAASATSPSAPAEEQGAPAAQASASYGPPNAEYRAWRDSRTTTLPAAIARARADKAAREKGQP